MARSSSESQRDVSSATLLDGEATPGFAERPARRFLTWLSVHRFEILIAAVAILPFVVAVVRSIVNGYTPIGDDGLLLLRSRDVFTEFNPLLGTWSSSSVGFGVEINNPGPLLFDLMALPVKLFGSGPGIAIGVAALNAACLLAAAVIAHRVGGRIAFLLILLVGASFAWSMGSELIYDVWQPHSLLYPFFLLIVLAWSVAEGRLKGLAWSIAVASLLIQTHLSYVYLAPLIILVGVALYLWSQRAGFAAALRSLKKPVLWSVVVGVVLWAQPLWQQLHGPGDSNMDRLIDAASGKYGSMPSFGTSLAVRFVGAVIALPPWILRSSFAESIPPERILDSSGNFLPVAGLPSLLISTLAVVLMMALLLGSAISARRLPKSGVLTSAILSASLVLFSVFTIKIMPIGPVDSAHQMRWLWPVGAFVIFSLLFRVFTLPNISRSAPWLVASLVGIVSLANLPTHVVAEGTVAYRDATPSVRSMISQVGRLDNRGILLFDPSTLRFAEPYSGPLLAALADKGIRFVTANEPYVHQLGEGRRYRCGAQWGLPDNPSACGVSNTLSVVSGIEAYAIPDGSERVIFIPGLNPQESLGFGNSLKRLEEAGVEFDGYGQPLNVPEALSEVALRYRELQIQRDRDSVAVFLRPAL